MAFATHYRKVTVTSRGNVLYWCRRYWCGDVLFVHSPGGATDLGTKARGLLSYGPLLYELRHQEVKDRPTAAIQPIDVVTP